ncbi:hypothetical protein HK104_003393, partial [Borealophlyctis nickersoniae]
MSWTRKPSRTLNALARIQQQQQQQRQWRCPSCTLLQLRRNHEKPPARVFYKALDSLFTPGKDNQRERAHDGQKRGGERGKGGLKERRHVHAKADTTFRLPSVDFPSESSETDTSRVSPLFGNVFGNKEGTNAERPGEGGGEEEDNEETFSDDIQAGDRPPRPPSLLLNRQYTPPSNTGAGTAAESSYQGLLSHSQSFDESSSQSNPPLPSSEQSSHQNLFNSPPPPLPPPRKAARPRAKQAPSSPSVPTYWSLPPAYTRSSAATSQNTPSSSTPSLTPHTPPPLSSTKDEPKAATWEDFQKYDRAQQLSRFPPSFFVSVIRSIGESPLPPDSAINPPSTPPLLDRFNTAYSVYEKMRISGVKPDQDTFLSLLHIAARDVPDQTDRLLGEMRAAGCNMQTASVYAYDVVGCANRSDLIGAEVSFGKLEMVADKEIEDSRKAVAALVEAYAHAIPGMDPSVRGRHQERMFELFERVRSLGAGVDHGHVVRAYRGIMHYQSTLLSPEEVTKLFHEIRGQVDDLTDLPIWHMGIKGSPPRRAGLLLHALLDKHLPFNHTTAQLCLEIGGALKDYTLILRGAGIMFKLPHMTTSGISSLKRDACVSLAEAYGPLNPPLLHELKRICSDLRLDTIKIMLALRHGYSDVSIRDFDSVELLGLEVCGHPTYGPIVACHMVAAAVRNKMPEAAMRTMEKLERRGAAVDGRCWFIVLVGYLRCGDAKGAVRVWREMKEGGWGVDRAVVEKVVRGLVKHEEFEA